MQQQQMLRRMCIRQLHIESLTSANQANQVSLKYIQKGLHARGEEYVQPNPNPTGLPCFLLFSPLFYIFLPPFSHRFWPRHMYSSNCPDLTPGLPDSSSHHRSSFDIAPTNALPPTHIRRTIEPVHLSRRTTSPSPRTAPTSYATSSRTHRYAQIPCTQCHVMSFVVAYADVFTPPRSTPSFLRTGWTAHECAPPSVTLYALCRPRGLKHSWRHLYPHLLSPGRYRPPRERLERQNNCPDGAY
jgi:hypothetical protein